LCKQLALSFAGKFLSMEVNSDLNWAEKETISFARRLMRPFEAKSFLYICRYWKTASGLFYDLWWLKNCWTLQVGSKDIAYSN
jgi:hypothetical protein